MIDQAMDTTRVQLGESMGVMGVSVGAEITQRQLHHQNPPQHRRQLTNLESWSTRHSLQAAQQIRQCPVQVPQLA